MDLIPEFRCERCGYDLSVQSDGGVCTECGTPIDESRPERRPGVAWQRSTTPAGWATGFVQYLFSPFRAFREARVETRSMRRLALVNLGLMVPLAVAPVILIMVFGRGRLTLEMATATPGSVIHIMLDGYPELLLVIGLLMVPLALAMFQWAAGPRALKQNPPLAPAAVWVSAGLTSYGVLLAIVLADLAWLLRWLVTPERIANATDSTVGLWSAAFALPFLVLFGTMVLFAVFDLRGNRFNRLANSLDPRPSRGA